MPDVGGLAAGGKVTAVLGHWLTMCWRGSVKGDCRLGGSLATVAPGFGHAGVPVAAGGVPGRSRGGVLGTGNPTSSPIPGGEMINNSRKAVTGAAEAAVAAPIAGAAGMSAAFCPAPLKTQLRPGRSRRR